MLILKLEYIHFLPFNVSKNCRVANSIDPDQMPQSVASDLSLHCLLRSVLIPKVNLVMLMELVPSRIHD